MSSSSRAHAWWFVRGDLRISPDGVTSDGATGWRTRPSCIGCERRARKQAVEPKLEIGELLRLAVGVERLLAVPFAHRHEPLGSASVATNV